MIAVQPPVQDAGRDGVDDAARLGVPAEFPRPPLASVSFDKQEIGTKGKPL